jgi:hypothetical protein
MKVAALGFQDAQDESWGRFDATAKSIRVDGFCFIDSVGDSICLPSKDS